MIYNANWKIIYITYHLWKGLIHLLINQKQLLIQFVGSPSSWWKRSSLPDAERALEDRARCPWLTLSPEKALDQKFQGSRTWTNKNVLRFHMLDWFILIYIDLYWLLIYIDLYHWFVCGQFAILCHFWIFRTPHFCERSAVLYIYIYEYTYCPDTCS